MTGRRNRGFGQLQARFLLALGLLCGLLLFTGSCGVEFDKASKFQAFRLLAVRADDPYPKPGEPLELDLLYHDAGLDAPRAVQVAWIWGCYNPPGDIYFNCAPFFAEAAEQLASFDASLLEGLGSPSPGSGNGGSAGAAGSVAGSGAAAAGAAQAGAAGAAAGGSAGAGPGSGGGSGPTVFADGIPNCSLLGGLSLTQGVCISEVSADAPSSSRLTMTLPAADADVSLESAPPLDFIRPPADNSPDYGLSVVFFAACAGELRVDLQGGNFPPFTCRDRQTGEALGSDDFIIGYTSLYSYEEGVNASNDNPEIQGLLVNGKSTRVDCAGEACSDVMPGPSSVDCADAEANCIRACPEDGDEEACPEISIKVDVDESIRQADDVSRARGRAGQEEVIWVRYFATRGAFGTDIKLINDAVPPHWNPDHDGVFFAPKEKGPLLLWAVVYDNRGGVNVVRSTLNVQ